MAKAPTGYTLVDDGLGHTFKIKNSNFDSFGRLKNPMLIINLVKMRDGRRGAKRDAEKAAAEK